MNQNYYVPDNGFQEMFLKTDGRINRMRYFKRLLVIGCFAVVGFIAIAVVFSDGYDDITPQGYAVMFVWSICINVLGYFIDVRRLHDMGAKSTLAVFILCASVVSSLDVSDKITTMASSLSSVGVLYLLFKKGMTGPNEYGPDPLGMTVAEYAAEQDNAADLADSAADVVDFTHNRINGNANTPSYLSTDNSTNDSGQNDNDDVDDDDDVDVDF